MAKVSQYRQIILSLAEFIPESAKQESVKNTQGSLKEEYNTLSMAESEVSDSNSASIPKSHR